MPPDTAEIGRLVGTELQDRGRLEGDELRGGRLPKWAGALPETLIAFTETQIVRAAGVCWTMARTIAAGRIARGAVLLRAREPADEGKVNVNPEREEIVVIVVKGGSRHDRLRQVSQPDDAEEKKERKC